MKGLLANPSSDAGSRKPYIDEAGAIHWPIVFVYPEVMQNDIVEDAAEHDTLRVSNEDSSSTIRLSRPNAATLPTAMEVF